MGRVSIRRILNLESTDVKDNDVLNASRRGSDGNRSHCYRTWKPIVFTTHIVSRLWCNCSLYLYIQMYSFFYDVRLKILWYFSKLGYVFNTDFSLITASGRSKVTSRVLPQWTAVGHRFYNLPLYSVTTNNTDIFFGFCSLPFLLYFIFTIFFGEINNNVLCFVSNNDQYRK